MNSPFADVARGPRPNQTLVGIECERDGLQPTKGDHTIDTITAHCDELQGLSGSDCTARVQELVEQDFRAEHPGNLAEAEAKELGERNAYVERALDPSKPHRGNGFGGSPNTGHYTPELQFFNLQEFPAGAELWTIGPDGSRVVGARFDGAVWDLQR